MPQVFCHNTLQVGDFTQYCYSEDELRGYLTCCAAMTRTAPVKSRNHRIPEREAIERSLDNLGFWATDQST